MKKLPIAKSSFKKIIEEGYIYVDKTKEIYDLLNYSPYAFLSRPRRFGKSLLVSTLEALFQGKKELFKGLWIEIYIDQFAAKEKQTETQLLKKITAWYDGYSWDGHSRLFNPYSIVNVLQDQKFNNYWFETGTPAILIKLIKEKYAIERATVPTVEEFENTETVMLDSSYDLEEQIPLVKLLYETGYLTIKYLERIMDDTLYTLSYPNYEVRHSFNTFILSAFSLDRKDVIRSKGTLMKRALLKSDKENMNS